MIAINYYWSYFGCFDLYTNNTVLIVSHNIIISHEYETIQNVFIMVDLSLVPPKTT